jgi:dTDP-4-dehydrorhamnose reductase
MLLENKKILITGANSGLGKFLAENLSGCIAITRDNNQYPNIEYDLVIHCAYNTKEKIDKYKILQDNIFFTKDLCKLKTKKFVYISTIDVYNQEKNEYNIVKRLAESIVEEENENYLILRCSAMIGKDMRKNNFLKIIQDDEPVLSLAKDSTFNFIRHEQILRIIIDSFNQNITGIYDVVSSSNVELKEVSKLLEKNCQYGKYKYTTSNIDNKKLISNFSYMNIDSLTNVKQFMRQTDE